MNRGAFSFSGRIDLPMSLKAKLEAVVYAAEEPVTLAQLAAIFSEEVLQGLAEEAPAEAGSAPAVEEASADESPATEAAGQLPLSQLPLSRLPLSRLLLKPVAAAEPRTLRTRATRRSLHGSATAGSGRRCRSCSTS